MELEVKKKFGKEEVIRHHTDKDVKEAHRRLGYDWRNNRLKLRVLPVNDKFREMYDEIDWGH